MSTVIYRCPHCGAPVTLNPQNEQLHCEYCLSDFSVSEINTQDQNTSTNKDTDGKINEYHCPSCGATVVTTQTTTATFCYYCHSPVVLSSRLQNEYKPTQIIPFSIDEKGAKQIFLNWCKTKMFLPNDFTSEKHVEKMTGVYFPYWLVDNELSCDYTAKSTKVRVSVLGDYETTETSFYEHIRQGDVTLVDIPAVALRSANEQLLNSLYPYHNQDIKPFTMSYLSGFFAGTYDKDKNDVNENINNQVNTYSQQLLERTLPSGCVPTSMQFDKKVTSQNWDFTLLPTWILTYKYNSKIYLFGINAQTGKVCGDLPINKKKLAIFTTLISSGAFAVLGAIGGFLLA